MPTPRVRVDNTEFVGELSDLLGTAVPTTAPADDTEFVGELSDLVGPPEKAPAAPARPVAGRSAPRGGKTPPATTAATSAKDAKALGYINAVRADTAYAGGLKAATTPRRSNVEQLVRMVAQAPADAMQGIREYNALPQGVDEEVLSPEQRAAQKRTLVVTRARLAAASKDPVRAAHGKEMLASLTERVPQSFIAPKSARSAYDTQQAAVAKDKARTEAVARAQAEAGKPPDDPAARKVLQQMVAWQRANVTPEQQRDIVRGLAANAEVTGKREELALYVGIENGLTGTHLGQVLTSFVPQTEGEQAQMERGGGIGMAAQVVASMGPGALNALRGVATAGGSAAARTAIGRGLQGVGHSAKAMATYVAGIETLGLAAEKAVGGVPTIDKTGAIEKAPVNVGERLGGIVADIPRNALMGALAGGLGAGASEAARLVPPIAKLGPAAYIPRQAAGSALGAGAGLAAGTLIAGKVDPMAALMAVMGGAGGVKGAGPPPERLRPSGLARLVPPPVPQEGAVAPLPPVVGERPTRGRKARPAATEAVTGETVTQAPTPEPVAAAAPEGALEAPRVYTPGETVVLVDRDGKELGRGTFVAEEADGRLAINTSGDPDSPMADLYLPEEVRPANPPEAVTQAPQPDAAPAVVTPAPAPPGAEADPVATARADVEREQKAWEASVAKADAAVAAMRKAEFDSHTAVAEKKRALLAADPRSREGLNIPSYSPGEGAPPALVAKVRTTRLAAQKAASKLSQAEERLQKLTEASAEEWTVTDNPPMAEEDYTPAPEYARAVEAIRARNAAPPVAEAPAPEAVVPAKPRRRRAAAPALEAGKPAAPPPARPAVAPEPAPAEVSPEVADATNAARARIPPKGMQPGFVRTPIPAEAWRDLRIVAEHVVKSIPEAAKSLGTFVKAMRGKLKEAADALRDSDWKSLWYKALQALGLRRPTTPQVVPPAGPRTPADEARAALAGRVKQPGYVAKAPREPMTLARLGKILERGLTDRLLPLQEAFGDLTRGKEVPIEETPYFHARTAVASAVDNVLEYALKGGLKDGEGDVPTLPEMRIAAGENYADLKQYWVVVNELSRAAVVGNERGLPPDQKTLDAGGSMEAAQAVTKQQYEALRAELEAMPKVASADAMMRRFVKAMMQKYAVDTGLLAPEARDAMEALHPNYMPLFDAAPPPKGGGKASPRGLSVTGRGIRKSSMYNETLVDPETALLQVLSGIALNGEKNGVWTRFEKTRQHGDESFIPVSARGLNIHTTTEALATALTKQAQRTPGQSNAEAARELLEQLGMAGTESANFYAPGTQVKDHPDIIQYYRNGKPAYARVNEDLQWMARHSTPKDFGILGKIAYAQAAMLRTFAVSPVLSPKFAAGNLIQDYEGVFAMHGVTPRDIITSALMLIDDYAKPRGNPFLRSLVQKGGKVGGEYQIDEKTAVALTQKIQDAMRKVEGRRLPNRAELGVYIKGVFKQYSMSNEMVNRLAIYGKLTGWDVNAPESAQRRAAFEALDQLDFNRQGGWLYVYNVARMAAFSNSTLQGFDKVRRFAMQHPGKAATMAVRGMAKRMAQLAVVTAMLYAVNRTIPDYNNLSPTDKDDYWYIPRLGPDGKWHMAFRIPRTHTIGVLSGMLPERMLMAIDEKAGYPAGGPQTEKGPAFDDLGKSLTSKMVPNPFPTSTVFAYQVIRNRRYNDTPIYPDYLRDAPNALKVTPSTSQTARYLGKITQDWRVGNADLSVAPAMFDYALTGLFGAPGRAATWLPDQVLARTNALPPAPTTPYPYLIPGLARFLTDQTRPTIHENRLYKELGRLEGRQDLADKGMRGPLPQAEADRLTALRVNKRSLDVVHKAMRTVLDEARTAEDIRTALAPTRLTVKDAAVPDMKRTALLALRRLGGKVSRGEVRLSSGGGEVPNAFPGSSSGKAFPGASDRFGPPTSSNPFPMR